MKRIAVFCDGTWNRPDQVHGGVPCPTNVVKLHRGVAPTAADGVEQLAFYEPGVGTGRFDRIRGGMFGVGLSANVKKCHAFLTDNYNSGDELHLFGFSRGAFTARSLAGLIGNSGIVKPEHRDRIDEAYDIYRDRDDPHKKPSGETASAFRDNYTYGAVAIRFIGVWDTVGALGIPLKIAALTKRWSFHDVRLGTHVGTAAHALAIDERRGAFLPTLWEQQAEAPSTQRLVQAWFAGVHSDVGGGYPDHALGDLTLTWMEKRAREAGLDVQVGNAHPDPLGAIHESYKSFYRLTRPRTRKLLGTAGGQAAEGAWRRMQELPGYHPQNLRDYLATDPPHADDL
jgi:uncharacterized protein (DUF2235 family)